MPFNQLDECERLCRMRGNGCFNQGGDCVPGAGATGLPRVAIRSSSCWFRAQLPVPSPSFSQTMCDLYWKPHAATTASACDNIGTPRGKDRVIGRDGDDGEADDRS